MTVHITLEYSFETTSGYVMVNAFCDGMRMGQLAFRKAVWKRIEERGTVAMYVATEFEEAK